MKTYVLYHGNCPDGTGAALAAYLKMGDFHGIGGVSCPVEYIPVNYGKPPPEIELGSRVYIVDFSYPRPVLENLGCAVCDQLVVLDHHETARSELEGLPGCHFDMGKSGAVLAWEYFHPQQKMPLFFDYLQDRDLWQFKLAQSREVSAAIGSYPFDFRVWANWIRECEDTIVRDLAAEGITCLRLKQQQVDNMAKHQRRVRLDGKYKHVEFYPPTSPGEASGFGVTVRSDQWACPVANATVFFSEVGERLLELNADAPFSAYYCDRGDGKRQWGLRSRPEFDCSIIAKAFGGGGHKQAAGFVQENIDP